MVCCERPYTYLVKLGDGSRRSVDANELSEHITTVGLVGVKFETDEVFGSLPVLPRSTQKRTFTLEQIS